MDFKTLFDVNFATKQIIKEMDECGYTFDVAFDIMNSTWYCGELDEHEYVKCMNKWYVHEHNKYLDKLMKVSN